MKRLLLSSFFFLPLSLLLANAGAAQSPTCIEALRNCFESVKNRECQKCKTLCSDDVMEACPSQLPPVMQEDWNKWSNKCHSEAWCG